MFKYKYLKAKETHNKIRLHVMHKFGVATVHNNTMLVWHESLNGQMEGKQRKKYQLHS